MLRNLRSLIGLEAFQRGLQTYGREWMYKHPQPYRPLAPVVSQFATGEGECKPSALRT